MRSEVVFVLAAVQLAHGVIYQLNESEYARMPPIYWLDDFEGCLLAPGDKYCIVDGKILDGDSELHTLIKEYSASTQTHYDHTQFHWGICVRRTCRQYYRNSTVEDALDACINATLYKSHQLQAKLVRKSLLCNDFGETDPYDTSDYVVAVVFLALLMLNVFGTLHDVFFQTNKGFPSKFLQCFSLRQNWKKLVMPSGEGPEPKLRNLTCLNGIKAITSFFVILGHTTITNFVVIGNPQYQEEIYHKVIYQVLLNGTLVVQTFFTVSGFLMAYNILVASEKQRVGWRTLAQGVIVRFLRLTPVYAVIIAFIMTWQRHLSFGPLWKPAVNNEVLDCRRDWWLHLLYVDNYVDNSQCMLPTWYISGDMQLSIVGMAIFYLCQSGQARKIAIAIAFVVGLVTPAAHTFFQNLHAVLIISPEIAAHFFVEDPTFNNLYKRGHTNLVCYAMGLALGMLMYNRYSQEDTKAKKNLRLAYWAAPLIIVGVIVLGVIFYIDGLEIPLVVRVVYSSLVKMCFGASICCIIAGTMMRLDSVYRGVLEWPGWTPISRISYCAYLIHLSVIRLSIASSTSVRHVSVFQTTLTYCGIVGVTYMLSAPCWLLVESPAAQAIKLCLGGSRNRRDVPVDADSPKYQEQEISNNGKTMVPETL